MLLERTLTQLDIGQVSPGRAIQMGRMGYIQWLGALRGDASYTGEVERALRAALPRCGSPAVAAFCELLLESLTGPAHALPLELPLPERRGGSQARRLSL